MLEESEEGENFYYVKFDPENPIPTVGGANLFLESGPYDQRLILSKEGVLYFSSKPFEVSFKLMGNVYSEIYFSTDVRDLDLCLRLVDIYPDERWMLIGDGCQRPRFRESFEYELPLEEGKIYKLKIDLGNSFYSFSPNHSLGIILTGSNYPRFEANPQSGEEIHKETKKQITNVKIFAYKRYNLKVVLPLYKDKEHKRPF